MNHEYQKAKDLGTTTSIVIDDIRNINATTVCRTPAQAYKELSAKKYDIYYFDHDIGFTEPGTSGYDILTWALENNHVKENCIVNLVTMNVVGIEKMSAALINHRFTKTNPRLFIRE